MRRTALCLLVVFALIPGPASARSVASACSEEATKKLIRAFVRAYNRGNVARIDNLIAQEPEFKWYFVDDERENDSEDRRTLRLYFERRILLNDHIRLEELSVRPDGKNFSFELTRTTDDERDDATGRFHGKGAASESQALPSLTDLFPEPTCSLSLWAMDNDVE